MKLKSAYNASMPSAYNIKDGKFSAYYIIAIRRDVSRFFREF